MDDQKFRIGDLVMVDDTEGIITQGPRTPEDNIIVRPIMRDGNLGNGPGEPASFQQTDERIIHQDVYRWKK